MNLFLKNELVHDWQGTIIHSWVVNTEVTGPFPLIPPIPLEFEEYEGATRKL